jgi:catechol 2,3-dioxygenase-like lactoylglutathione lyase family enzyme
MSASPSTIPASPNTSDQPGSPSSPTAPTVSGVFETSLYVADLPRSYAFYHDLFGFELIGPEVKPDDRLAALKVGDRQVLLLFRQGASSGEAAAADGRVLPHDARGQIHVAFAVAAADIDAWGRRLLDHGLTIERTIDWRPGVRSHYVRDPDGHLVELATPGVWGVSW